MKKGCIIALTSFLLVLIGGVATVYLTFQSLYNPYYNGKRVYAWAKQAVNDPDPAERRVATQALVEAFKGMQKGEPRIQLVMGFCSGRYIEQGGPELPEEVVPFLIEALHAEEMPPGSYQSMALSEVRGTAAVAALVEVVLHDDDPHARAGALSALQMIQESAKEKGNKEVQLRVEAALREIEQAAGEAAK
jgi:hypothetical protein